MDKQLVVNEWLKYSDKDLLAINQLLTHRPLAIEIICYLCQQSAEKALKAFWLHLETEPPKTHNLNFLNEKCVEFDTSFEEIVKQCERLNHYSNQPRYPSPIDISEEMMNLAVKDATAISDFVKAKLSQGEK